MIWRALAWPFVALVTLLASWFGGRNVAKSDAKVEGLEDYVETRKRMDDVARLSDADIARMFLEERGKR